MNGSPKVSLPTLMTLLPSFAECKARIEQISLFSCCVALTIAPSALRKLKKVLTDIMQWDIIRPFKYVEARRKDKHNG